jgi:hypothetical protein
MAAAIAPSRTALLRIGVHGIIITIVIAGICAIDIIDTGSE